MRAEAKTLTALAKGYEGLTQYEKGIGYLLQALAIRQERQEKPETAFANYALGRVYSLVGQHETALHHLDEARSLAHRGR